MMTTVWTRPRLLRMMTSRTTTRSWCLLPLLTSAPPLLYHVHPSLLQGLTENQRRLLYLMSLYTHPAESSSEKEKWIRKPSALVMIYEGIVAQVLDYDYAPSSEVVESRRMYFNISQVTFHTSLQFVLLRCVCGCTSGRES